MRIEGNDASTNQKTKMNHLISQIANFENCNAGVPLSLLRFAAADVIADEWQDNAALIAAIDAGMDYDDAAASVNESLEDAGCEHRVDSEDMEAALKSWVEFNRDEA